MTLEGLARQASAAFKGQDFTRAEPLFRQIVELQPRDAGAWHALALILCRTGRAEEAAHCALAAHKLEKRNHIYLNTLGVSHMEAGRMEDALRWFRRCLGERPDYADAHYNLARAQHKLGRFEDAERAYRSALRIVPSMADAAINAADLCIRTGRYDDALALLDHAASLAPDSPVAAINRSLALLAKRGPAAAIGEISAFLESHPDAAAARLHLALLLLGEGRLPEGWREYSWRHRAYRAARPPGLAHELPQAFQGSTVALVPDQGLGDQLFFLRFASLLRDRGARVLFACPQKMLAMLRDAPGVDQVLACDAGSVPEMQGGFVVALGDLPRLASDNAVPPPFSLAVSTERLSAWRARLAEIGPAPYLGVTWRGGTKAQASEFSAEDWKPIYKEIDLQALAKAVRPWRGTVLVLQRLPGPGEVAAFSRALRRPAHDLSPLNEQLEDMAALLKAIDEYAGVSNTNMHIRAGVGRGAKVLVPFPPEFRWMSSGDSSPWFPGFRLFRQPPTLDWTEALAALSRSLES
jgi:Flp pilus assembly protein TadD